MGGMRLAEEEHPNTCNNLLTQAAWERLLSRIGDAFMLYLIMHTSIFVPLANSCYLQVAGRPLAQVQTLSLSSRVPLQHFFTFSFVHRISHRSHSCVDSRVSSLLLNFLDHTLYPRKGENKRRRNKKQYELLHLFCQPAKSKQIELSPSFLPPRFYDSSPTLQDCIDGGVGNSSA